MENKNESCSSQEEEIETKALKNVDKYEICYLPKDIIQYDKKFLISKLTQQLKLWAKDTQLDHQKAVRNMYAKWHPDRQRDPKINSICTDIFQAIQQEVRSIQEEKERRQKKFDKAKQEREEKQMQKETEKQAKLANRRDINMKIDQQSQINIQNKETIISNQNARPWPRTHFSFTKINENTVWMFGGEWFKGDKTIFYGELTQLQFPKNLNQTSNDEIKCLKKYSSSVNAVGPTARSSHQCVSGINNDFYLFGGCWNSPDGRRFKQYDDLWKYDQNLGKWNRIGEEMDNEKNLIKNTSMPSARSGHRMVYYKENLYIFGGYEEIKKGNTKYLNDFYSYDVKQNKWTKDKRKVEKPSPRAGFCMWIREGFDLDDDQEYEDDNQIDDNNSQDDQQQINLNVNDQMQKRIYIYGGSCMKGEKLQVLKDCWYFDLHSFEWIEVEVQNHKKVLGSMNRSGMSFCKWNEDKLLFFGGVTDVVQENTKEQTAGLAVFHNEIMCLNLKSLSWEMIWTPQTDNKAINYEKIKETVKKYDNQGGVDSVMLFKVNEGGDIQKRAKKSQFSNFDAEEEQIYKIKMPRGRMGAGSVVINEKLFVYGGSCESGQNKELTLDDLWSFDLNSQLKEWNCVLAPSDRIRSWFDEGEQDEDEYYSDEPEQQQNVAPVIIPTQNTNQNSQVTTVSLALITDPSKLSKKEKAKWEKKQRSEIKIVKQQEKEAKSKAKKEEKINKQKEKAKNKKNESSDEENSDDE